MTEKLYLGGDFYTAAAVYVKSGTGSWLLYYICRDYLGSITHITNSSGNLYSQYSYDAWGRLRNPSTQTVYEPGTEPTLFLGRGYTGHEHLPWFGLVNMNARLYDPATGRFLSPDPFVQAPDFSQSFNRYSYALNNPLRYIDQEGEFWHIIIGAVVGGIINVATHWNQIDSFGEGFAAFGIGAAGGALAAATGGAALGAFGTAAGAGGFIGGAVAGGVGYTFGTAATSMGNNAAFGDPMPTAGQFFTGLGISVLTGGVINGAVAAMRPGTPGNFWTGDAVAQGRGVFSLNNAPKLSASPSVPKLQGPALPQPELNLPEPKPLDMPVVNAKGTPYPKVAVEGYGEVPFPEGPYTPNNSQILRTEFSLQMRAEFKSWWTQQGRPLPASKYEIHHIQPLKFGGTNNFQNLVPLQPQQHLQFTNWWRGFTIYF